MICAKPTALQFDWGHSCAGLKPSVTKWNWPTAFGCNIKSCNVVLVPLGNLHLVATDEIRGIGCTTYRVISSEQLESEIKSFIGSGNHIIKKSLEEKNIDLFIEVLKSLFSSVSYLLFERSEKSYHTPLFLLLRAIFDSKVRADELQSAGRTDIIIDLDKVVYILELKLDQDSKIALDQIYEKEYYKPYLISGKQLFFIGINFSSKLRNIDDFIFERYSDKNIMKLMDY